MLYNIYGDDMDNVEIVELDTKPVVKNKIPWGTIIVFIVLILLIGGYFIYDIFFNKEKVEVSFSFKNDSITMGLNSAYDLKDNIDFTNLGIESITFVLSDNQIVSLENNALISNTKVGEVTLTATYKDIVRTMNVIVSDGTDKTLSLKFLRSSIDLNDNSSKNVYKYLDLKNIDKSSVVFSSSDSTVAYISGDNIITKGNGETVISAKFDDITSSMKVVVGKKYLKFKDSEINLNNNSNTSVYDFLNMLGIEKNNIVFKSSDNSLVYVDNGSIITRDKSGECTLKATIGDLDTEVKVVVK